MRGSMSLLGTFRRHYTRAQRHKRQAETSPLYSKTRPAVHKTRFGAKVADVICSNCGSVELRLMNAGDRPRYAEDIKTHEMALWCQRCGCLYYKGG